LISGSYEWDSFESFGLTSSPIFVDDFSNLVNFSDSSAPLSFSLYDGRESSDLVFDDLDPLSISACISIAFL
jgi:hypothetical protein